MTPSYFDNTPSMRIGDAAEATGLSASSLRQYEQLGLLLPDRDSRGNRLYSKNEVEWVKMLQQFFRDTHTGPHAAVQLLALLPSQKLRQRILGVPCRRAKDNTICWLSCGDDAGYRAECRSCPAYLGKEMALRFGDYFDVVLRGADKRAVAVSAEARHESRASVQPHPQPADRFFAGQLKKSGV